MTHNSIDEAIKGKGFTYSHISRLTGVSRKVVAGIAKGTIKRQTFETVAPILDLLGIKMQDYSDFLKAHRGKDNDINSFK